jgi:hypothetical protein
LRRRLFVSACALIAAAALAPARAQDAAELHWTKVAKADLERFESAAGNVRVNNVVVQKQKDGEGAGPATQFEFSASVANRGGDRVRVYLQIVGVKADGTPTLSCDTYVDVDSRRNESVRETFRAAASAADDAASYWVRALAVP